MLSAALEVVTRDSDPFRWAGTLNNLGNALLEQGRQSIWGRAALLAKAVIAFNEALEVYDAAEYPFHSALTHNNLGAALATLGTNTVGKKGAALLVDAIAAFHQALGFFTREAHPVHWALTQESLARSKEARAQHDTSIDPRPHLREALEHVEAALTVYDPEHMLHNHTRATTLRERLRAALNGGA